MFTREHAHTLRWTPLTAVALAVWVAAASGAVTKVQTLEGITEYRLDNGVQLLLYPDPTKPTVTVNMTVLVGSRHEGYGEYGMAHLLEHMVFKGTPKHAKIPEELRNRGASFNGSTSNDRTNYYETLPASDENLEWALDLESDRLVNSYVKQEDLLSEMTVVRNEFERSENSPGALLGNRVRAAAFDWHNYGKSTIGNRTDIERVPIHRLQEFYKKYYQPDNIMLVVAGKFDEAKALALVEKYFGSIPKPSRRLDKTYTEEPPQDGERSVVLRRVGDVAQVNVVYHIPSGGHPEAAALDVLAGALSNAPSGRLYKALVETKKATSANAGAANAHDPSLFSASAQVPKDASLDVARDTLLDVLENAWQTPFTQEEVNRIKERTLKQRELNAGNTSQIAIGLSSWAAQGDWRLYLLSRDLIEKVTPQDVQNAAKKYLKRDNRTAGVFIPTDKLEVIEIPRTPDLAKVFEGYKGREAIAEGEWFDPTPANIDARTKWSTLPEGVQVALLPKKNRGETVMLRLTLRYGNQDSLKGYNVAAGMLPQLMMRGTKNLSRQQLQDALDKERATLSAGGGTGSVSFTIDTKRANLPAAINIMRQVMREPLLPAEEFAIMQRQRVAGQTAQLNNPTDLASTRLRRTLSPYDKTDVRYTPTPEEDVDLAKGATLEQVQTLFQDFLGSQAGELVIVGDFDADACLKPLAEALSGWKAKQPYARIERRYFGDIPGGFQKIVTPDKANAQYLAGLSFPMKESDPDYPAIILGNYVFGGGGSLSSRLGDRIRQKDGLSYNVGSSISVDALDARANLQITAICNPQNIGRVNSDVTDEMTKLWSQGITATELDAAKQAWLQSRQRGRTSDSSLLGTLGENLHVGRKMSYYSDLETKVAALTPDQVLAALKKWIDPKKLVVINAGDFAPGSTAAN